MKKRKRQTNRLRIFYYSHPYFAIFMALILFNALLILVTALLLDVIQCHVSNTNPWTVENYLSSLEYCAIFTMNSGGLYDDAAPVVVAFKIIVNVIQTITFTGALIGLATSLLQNTFDKRIHNVGKLKIKNHYVILNWSKEGANLVRELSFTEGRKNIVILSDDDRDSIMEDIDNLFLETGTTRKKTSIFVKQGDPSSRKALKEVAVDKAISVAMLSKADSSNDFSSDVSSFKLLMSIISISKNINLIIETENEEVMKNIKDLVDASPDLKECHISFFSKATVIGNALGKTAINSDFDELYYYLLSHKNGGINELKENKSIEEALLYYNNALPLCHFKDDPNNIYALSNKMPFFYKKAWKSKYLKEIPIEIKLLKKNMTLFIIGKNSRADEVIRQVEEYSASGEGHINWKNYDFDVDIEEVIEEIAKTKGKKKVLLLSDDQVDEKSIDVNVFMSILKLRASKKIGDDVKIAAELLNSSNKSSIESLNINDLIISNQMIALYLVQLMSHPEGFEFYEGFLSSAKENPNGFVFDIRKAEEIIKIDEPIEFSSRGEFINAVYKGSHGEFMPIGFVKEDDSKKSLLGMAGNAVGAVVGATSKLIGGIANAITLNDEEGNDVSLDVDNIILLSNKLRKKQKIRIEKGMDIIFVHYLRK